MSKLQRRSKHAAGVVFAALIGSSALMQQAFAQHRSITIDSSGMAGAPLTSSAAVAALDADVDPSAKTAASAPVQTNFDTPDDQVPPAVEVINAYADLLAYKNQDDVTRAVTVVLKGEGQEAIAKRDALVQAAQKQGLTTRYTYDALFVGFSLDATTQDLHALLDGEDLRAIYPVQTVTALPVSHVVTGAEEDKTSAAATSGTSATSDTATANDANATDDTSATNQTRTRRKRDLASNTQIDLPGAEDERLGEGKVIAVLDTGIYTNDSLSKITDISKAKIQSADYAKSKGITYGTWLNEKVPFAFDYIDMGTEKIGSGSDHGTHVAGIIAGNPQGEDQTDRGVLPEAQILAMRILGDSGTGSGDDIIFKAADDAVKLGADAINMSLGVSSGDAFYDRHNQAMAALAKIGSKYGVFVAVAAGNDGAAFLQTDGTVDADIADYGVIASPSTYPLNASVASINNVKKLQTPVQLYSTTDGTETEGETLTIDSIINANKLPEGFYNKKYGVVYAGLGQEIDYTGKDVTGKIVVVSRGSITFEAKANTAQQKGAVLLVIVNNEPGTLNASLGDSQFPAVVADQSKLSVLQSASSISIGDKQVLASYDGASEISDFSSWGAALDQDALRPDLLAPGGDIYSSLKDNTHGYYSGTSMATPHVAAAAALVRDRAIALGATGAEINELTLKLLMTYAEPQIQELGTSVDEVDESSGTDADNSGDNSADSGTESNGSNENSSSNDSASASEDASESTSEGESVGEGEGESESESTATTPSATTSATTATAATSTTYVSPRRQGAGLIKVARALKGEVVIEGTAGRSSQFYSSVTTEIPLSYTLRNYGDTAHTYSYKVVTQTDKFSEDGTKNLLQAAATNVSATGTVTVPAKGSVEVKTTLDISSLSFPQATNGFYVDGFVFFTNTDTGDNKAADMSAPFAAFKGNYTETPTFEASVYKLFKENKKPTWFKTNERWGVGFTALTTGEVYTLSILGEYGADASASEASEASEGSETTLWADGQRGFDEAKIAFSPNGDGEFDSVVPQITLLKNASGFKAQITRASDGAVVRTLTDSTTGYDYYQKNYVASALGVESSPSNGIGATRFTDLAWDGKDDNGALLPDGDYIYTISGHATSSPDKTESVSFPVKIDTKAPKFKAYYDPETKKLTLVDLSDEGVGAQAPNVYLYAANTALPITSESSEEAEGDTNGINSLVWDLSSAAAYVDNCVVEVADFAGNKVRTQVTELPKAESQYKIVLGKYYLTDYVNEAGGKTEVVTPSYEVTDSEGKTVSTEELATLKAGTYTVKIDVSKLDGVELVGEATQTVTLSEENPIAVPEFTLRARPSAEVLITITVPADYPNKETAEPCLVDLFHNDRVIKLEKVTSTTNATGSEDAAGATSGGANSIDPATTEDRSARSAVTLDEDTPNDGDNGDGSDGDTVNATPTDTTEDAETPVALETITYRATVPLGTYAVIDSNEHKAWSLQPDGSSRTLLVYNARRASRLSLHYEQRKTILTVKADLAGAPSDTKFEVVDKATNKVVATITNLDAGQTIILPYAEYEIRPVGLSAERYNTNPVSFEADTTLSNVGDAEAEYPEPEEGLRVYSLFKPSEAWTALEALIAEYEAKLPEAETAEKDTAELKAALDAAKALLEDHTASDEALNSAGDAIKTAWDALWVEPEPEPAPQPKPEPQPTPEPAPEPQPAPQPEQPSDDSSQNAPETPEEKQDSEYVKDAADTKDAQDSKKPTGANDTKGASQEKSSGQTQTEVPKTADAAVLTGMVAVAATSFGVISLVGARMAKREGTQDGDE